MPRPMNWVRGEGTTEVQRRGLQGGAEVYDMVPGYVFGGMGDATTGAPCPGSPGCPGYVDPSTNLSDPFGLNAMWQAITDNSTAIYNQTASGGSGVSSTVLLLGGGVLLLFLLKK